LNYKEKLNKIKAKLRDWKRQNLSIKGKVTIINTLCIPILIYTANVIWTPPEVIKEAKEIIIPSEFYKQVIKSWQKYKKNR
jgi:hypothetical protein